MTRTRRHLRIVPDLYDDVRRQRLEPQRRPARDERVAYRLRIELVDIQPLIWREFEVASDTRLNDLHNIVQVVMGWTDSHLHRFAVGADWYLPDTAEFITEFDIEEGEEGVLESAVGLDEVLQDAGDQVLYLYDFGDGWRHTITLQGERPLPDTVGDPARCLAGARACPPENCGGEPGYGELLDDLAAAAAGDTLSEWQRERLRWLCGDQAPKDFRGCLETFETDDVNAILDRRAVGQSLPVEIRDLIARLPLAAVRSPELGVLLERIPTEPPAVDSGLAREMTEPFAWMIRRIGDGLRLTAAGYLRPDDVVAVAEKLNLADEWIGMLNREDRTPAVTDFRMAMRHLGLARQANGRLLPTKIARALVDEPVRLWWHIAGRLPLEHGPERDAALIGVLVTAAGIGSADPAAGQWYQTLMTALGWRYQDGQPLDATDNPWTHSITHVVLHRAGGVELEYGRAHGAPTMGGVLLARAALT